MRLRADGKQVLALEPGFGVEDPQLAIFESGSLTQFRLLRFSGRTTWCDYVSSDELASLQVLQNGQWVVRFQSLKKPDKVATVSLGRFQPVELANNEHGQQVKGAGFRPCVDAMTTPDGSFLVIPGDTELAFVAVRDRKFAGTLKYREPKEPATACRLHFLKAEPQLTVLSVDNTGQLQAWCVDMASGGSRFVGHEKFRQLGSSLQQVKLWPGLDDDAVLVDSPSGSWLHFPSVEVPSVPAQVAAFRIRDLGGGEFLAAGEKYRIALWL